MRRGSAGLKGLLRPSFALILQRVFPTAIHPVAGAVGFRLGDVDAAMGAAHDGTLLLEAFSSRGRAALPGQQKCPDDQKDADNRENQQ